MTTGHRLFYKELLCFNTMPCRHMPLPVHFWWCFYASNALSGAFRHASLYSCRGRRCSGSLPWSPLTVAINACLCWSKQAMISSRRRCGPSTCSPGTTARPRSWSRGRRAGLCCWAVIFVPLPLPRKVIQTSCCTRLLFKCYTNWLGHGHG